MNTPCFTAGYDGVEIVCNSGAVRSNGHMLAKFKKNADPLNQTASLPRRSLDARLAQTARHTTPRATFGRLALSCLQCSRARRPLPPTQVGRRDQKGWGRAERNSKPGYFFVHANLCCAPRQLDKHVHEFHELERAVRAQLTFPEEEWQVQKFEFWESLVSDDCLLRSWK